MDTVTRPRLAAPLSPPRRWGTRHAVAGLILLAGLIALRLFAPAGGGVDLGRALQDFLTLSVSVIVESLPFVFLGIGLSTVVQHWVPSSLLFRLLPRVPFLRRIVLSLLGVLLPVCECGNVPLSRGLILRGVSVPEAMTFLVAAPIVNPVTILTTFQAFGFSNGILLSRVLGGFVLANLIGWLFSKHPDQDALLTRSFSRSCDIAHDHRHVSVSAAGKLRASVDSFRHETTAMLPALFVGSAIAGLIQVAVSRDVLVALGSNPVASVFVLMLLAFVVAVCSNVDAFFILALGSTFMPGAIVAFLVFGPVIDVKMLALLRTTFTTRTLVLLTVVVALGAASIGLALNLA